MGPAQASQVEGFSQLFGLSSVHATCHILHTTCHVIHTPCHVLLSCVALRSTRTKYFEKGKQKPTRADYVRQHAKI